jgi:hypothetical protein
MMLAYVGPAKRVAPPAPAAAVPGDWPGPALDDFPPLAAVVVS